MITGLTMQNSSLKAIDILALVLLSATWASSFSFIKIGLDSFGPLSLAATRIVISAVFLWVFLKLKGHSLPSDKQSWKTLFIAAFTATTLPFVMISWGQQFVDSGTAAILMAFAPIATVILAHALTSDEKMTPSIIIAVLAGFAGVYVLFDGGNFSLQSKPLQGQIMILLATVGYALSNIFIKRTNYMHPMVSGTGVMVAAAILITPISLIFDPFWHYDITPRGWFAVIYLGIVTSGLAALIMVWIIFRRGVTFMSFNNFMLPIFAIIWGYLLLDEVASANSWLALVLILSGLGIMILSKKRHRTSIKTNH